MERKWTALIHNLFTGKTGEMTKTDSFDMWSGGKSASTLHIWFPYADFANAGDPVTSAQCFLKMMICLHQLYIFTGIMSTDDSLFDDVDLRL